MLTLLHLFARNLTRVQIGNKSGNDLFDRQRSVSTNQLNEFHKQLKGWLVLFHLFCFSIFIPFFMYIISPAGSCKFASLRNVLVLISTKLEIMSSTILISHLLLSYSPKNRLPRVTQQQKMFLKASTSIIDSIHKWWPRNY